RYRIWREAPPPNLLSRSTGNFWQVGSPKPGMTSSSRKPHEWRERNHPPPPDPGGHRFFRIRSSAGARRGRQAARSGGPATAGVRDLEVPALLCWRVGDFGYEQFIS